MPQSRRRMGLRLSVWSLLIIGPLGLAGAIAAGVLPLGQRPAKGVSVIRHKASEMPKLDVGVQQAVHATFVGDRNPAVGSPANLRLVVTSGAPDVGVTAEIKLPARGIMERGLSKWEGTLSKLETAEIPLSVLLPDDRGGFVRAEITALLPDGREIRSATAVYVDPGAPDNPAPEAKTLTEPDGRTLDVVVYRPAGR